VLLIGAPDAETKRADLKNNEDDFAPMPPRTSTPPGALLPDLSAAAPQDQESPDEAMIAETKAYAAAKKIPRDAFEFQMLYGVRTDLQRQLVRDGYRVRIYIPFGHDWFPYFMRRLAERPANVAFFLRNFLR